jgi:hypothetical protein
MRGRQPRGVVTAGLDDQTHYVRAPGVHARLLLALARKKVGQMKRQIRAACRRHRHRLLLLLVLNSVQALLTPGVICAHGVVGNRIFLSPIIGNDAFPDNDVSLTTRGSDYEFSLLPQFEKQLSDSSSVLFTGGWTQIKPSGSQRKTEGSTDLSIWFRQAILKSAQHELEITGSPFLVVPIGNRQIPDQGYMHLGGEILLGKGLGDLPNVTSLKYLRSLAVQTEVGYAARVQGPANSDVFGNLELEYSLRYLDDFVERVDWGRPLIQLVPFVQLNYAQSFLASRLTTKPDFRLTPGLAYQNGYCQVSVGAQVALNNAAATGDRIAAIGLVEIFYDDIFPTLRWKPF